MAHLTLPKVSRWSDVRDGLKEKAERYFMDCLERGFGVSLCQNPNGPQWGIVLGKHSQASPLRILSLVALAELAFLSTAKEDKQKAIWLLKCAKWLYKIHYGEDDTFKDHHRQYRCSSLHLRMVPVQKIRVLGAEAF